jgi:hypothetical protein
MVTGKSQRQVWQHLLKCVPAGAKVCLPDGQDPNAEGNRV